MAKSTSQMHCTVRLLNIAPQLQSSRTRRLSVGLLLRESSVLSLLGTKIVSRAAPFTKLRYFLFGFFAMLTLLAEKA